MSTGRKRWTWMKLVGASILFLFTLGRLVAMDAFDLSVEEPLWRLAFLLMFVAIAADAADDLRSERAQAPH